MKTKNQPQNIKETNLLTESELKEILGGFSISLIDDVNNLNRITDCICTYKNYNIITNTNEVQYCTCQCVK